MSWESPFVRPAESYGRDLNILHNARQDAAHYISTVEGIPYEEALAFVQEETGKGGSLACNNPPTRILHRDAKKGRQKQVVPFSEYLMHVDENNLLMSPTMTVYQNPHVERSILSEYIDGNIQKRKVVKKAGQRAKANGDHADAAIKHVLQSTFKIKNNSLSGAHSSPHNSLYLKSAHPTLTSTCRSATSYSNANTERFLMGNRHYRDADITLNNIVSVVQMSNYDKIKETMDKYNLHYPSAQEVIVAVKRSTDIYWRSESRFARIVEYINALTPLQRAAYLYTQDMFHLTQYNPDVVRSFVTPLAVKATEPVANPKDWMDMMDADITALIGIVCAAELKGTTWWDMALIYSYGAGDLEHMGVMKKEEFAAELEKLKGDKPEESFLWPKNGKDDLGLAISVFEAWNKEPYDLVDIHHRYGLIGAQVKQTFDTLNRFSLLISAFWCTDNPPCSMAFFNQSIRKSVVVSDTDSTIFTVQDWVRWYNDGALKFDDVSNAVGAVMVFLTSQTTIHLLAQLSAGMGVVPEHLGKLEMKNEFFFPVLSLTTKAKHYYSYISACEGNVYAELEPEYKGVSLKNSKIPKHIMARFQKFTEEIMDTVMREEKISLRKELQIAMDIENDIRSSLEAGKTQYLQLSAVKAKESYKNPQSSPYVHYEMWQEVFAAKYGDAPAPSYLGVKISLDLNNQTAVKRWLANMEDRVVAENMKRYLEARGKKDFKMAILPLDVVERVGVPKELLAASDTRKVCATLLEPFILVLESLGLYMNNGNNTKLPSDYLADLLMKESGIV